MAKLRRGLAAREGELVAGDLPRPYINSLIYNYDPSKAGRKRASEHLDKIEEILEEFYKQEIKLILSERYGIFTAYKHRYSSRAALGLAYCLERLGDVIGRDCDFIVQYAISLKRLRLYGRDVVRAHIVLDKVCEIENNKQVQGQL